ncbi:hypothetical protein METP3_02987 [Methanosarcinales archaeon]|nr:hypothetical protein METP3_02987 [Methanosarcinales archaeon]
MTLKCVTCNGEAEYLKEGTSFCRKHLPSDNEKKEVSVDTVYSELYEEMRRFRDHELNSSTWYIVILLAFMSFLLSETFGPNKSDLSKIPIIFQIFIVILIISIVFSGIYSIYYSGSRYRELRTYTQTLEPEWKTFQPKTHCFAPRNLIYLVLFLIGLLIVLLLFYVFN